jgi:NAD(P)-dependent dehydrogenase (short-subunit alcohol dehydrogenase family)
VSSIASQRPSATELVYGPAKAGLNALTYGLARTLGPTVRVNCIVPGPFLTDISKAWDMAAFERGAKAGYALQRGGEPHEIVGAALYFASAAGSYTTGGSGRESRYGPPPAITGSPAHRPGPPSGQLAGITRDGALTWPGKVDY